MRTRSLLLVFCTIIQAIGRGGPHNYHERATWSPQEWRLALHPPPEGDRRSQQLFLSLGVLGCKAPEDNPLHEPRVGLLVLLGVPELRDRDRR